VGIHSIEMQMVKYMHASIVVKRLIVDLDIVKKVGYYVKTVEILHVENVKTIYYVKIV
jgi:hypothetical protein